MREELKKERERLEQMEPNLPPAKRNKKTSGTDKKMEKEPVSEPDGEDDEDVSDDDSETPPAKYRKGGIR